MENNRPPSAPSPPSGDSGLGPRKGGRLPSGQPLSRSRRALLDILRAQPQPTTLAALIALTGLHGNTLREHLEGLQRDGLVRRRRAVPHGRGRPAWLYEADQQDESSERSEYAGLAAALASAIHRTSDAPEEEARVAGEDWGHQLAREKGRPDRVGASAARRQVVAMLEDVGFAPEADERDTVVRLTRCPLLEAAHRYPEVVCAVHLGLVRGALDEYGADSSRTRLHPFSEPGACRLELMASPERDGRS